MPLDGPPANGNARLAGMPANTEPPPDGPGQIDTAAAALGTAASVAAAPVAAVPVAAASGTAEQAAPEQAAPEQGAPEQAGPVPQSAALAGLEAAAPELGAVEPGPGPQPRRAPASRSGGRPDLVTWLIAAAVFAAYTVISVFRYLRRDPTSWDLGIFTEYVKQYAHLRAPIVDVRGAGFNLAGDHFHPIVGLIAPFFRLFPSPVTLLVVQALLAAASVFAVSRAGRELLGPGQGRAIAAAYGFSWGLQQMVNYDFHEIAFAVPLLAFSLSALVRGRIRPAVLWALPLVFVKEDQGFTLAAVGLIMVFAYRRRGPGFFLAGWGLLWSFLAILVILPHFSASHTYGYWFAGGAVSAGGGHISLGGLWGNLANGASIKLPALALILLPTAFIALRSPLILAAVPSLLLRFVGTNPDYWNTQWHYNATIMPIVFIAAIDAMSRMQASRPARQTGRGEAGWGAAAPPGAGPPGAASPRKLAVAAGRYGAATMIGASAALAFQFPLSSLWTPSTYYLGPHVAAENAAMALVPNGAKVATDLDLLAPLAARTDTFWLGNYGTNPSTQYVVFDNQSTDWPPQTNVLAFVESVTHNTRYKQIYAKDNVFVFRRLG
jgi:uncharacterized membrane protein